MDLPKHPARFSEPIIDLIEEILDGWSPHRVLDPYGGVGTIARLKRTVLARSIVVIHDIQERWARQAYRNGADLVVVGDAGNMPFPSGSFCCIITSPTYGNRMADHHQARDSSIRYTYTHMHGSPLEPGNTGAMHWGDPAYTETHLKHYREFWRVLREGGHLILNVSDHIADDVQQQVSLWHYRALIEIGFVPVQRRQVVTKRQRNGANGDKRVPYEWVFEFIKPFSHAA